ncbi:tetratricopeptide repeat protein [Tahibacter amnicola]|uniref:Tetratricopeptide repeat protein n=1 Tax=Tahibacter amnicola TaxID=2976241 RepID=A0ABY6BK52_9GAMM|nr:tetratricopeptide repeat protein [Tahibacter amnicola]UXI70245.1 tetratricopeptide repeat protein [Tahibacter amnicola]
MDSRICVLLLAFAAAVASPGEALSGTFPHCDEPVAPLAPPDPTICLSRNEVASPVAATGQALQGLFARTEEHVAAGRFDAASDALACADAIAGAAPAFRYEVVRRFGILEFRRERIPQALRHFHCAAEMAAASGDPVAQARDLKNVGAALRRLGDFQGALQALTTSLTMQRAAGAVSGAVLNNLADVYRDLDEPRPALQYYREALKWYQDNGEKTEAAHVLESMAEASLDAADAAQADAWLQEALATYRAEKNRVYELRVHDGLARAALAQGDLARARHWSASALAIAADGALPLPPALQRQIARTERLSGRPDAAIAQLRSALGSAVDDDPERVPLWEELAAAQTDAGEHAAANDSLRRANGEAREVSRAQHHRQLDWLRIRFETAERDRTIAALESENRARTLQLWGLVVSGLAAILGLWLLFERRRQRHRLEAEARRVRLEEELARYRREADALAEDRNLLKSLLDSRDDAACLLDAEGQILVCNRAACRLIGVDADQLTGQSMTAYLDAGDGAASETVFERMEDSTTQTLELATRDGARVAARITQWPGGGGRLVMELAPRSDVAAAAEVTPLDTGESDGDDMRQAFRVALVDLMLAAIEAWESATASNRIELAEKSRIWRVNIDDGRLRARAMERYLSVAKLPQNPRWRDVLRTAYYVLGQCAGMTAESRARLQGRVDVVLGFTRRDAMV